MHMLFCFHGYGENAESFGFLEERLGTDYTMIAIDLPFHGKTQWTDGLLFTPGDLVNIVTQLQAIFQPANKANPQSINLLGYSMGGRVVLQLLQTIPSIISRAVLIAPDGLHKNRWYKFSTQTFVGNKVFRRVMYKPAALFWLLKKGQQYKLAHASIIKVAHYYLDDAEERIKLYNRWTTMRKFKPKLGVLKKMIARHSIAVRFLFGRYDNIILSERSSIFAADAHNIQVHVIDAGHRLMQEKYAGEIAKLFYQ
jgi:pimeloyl-ACP methyl ester carboxylesterase